MLWHFVLEGVLLYQEGLQPIYTSPIASVALSHRTMTRHDNYFQSKFLVLVWYKLYIYMSLSYFILTLCLGKEGRRRSWYKHYTWLHALVKMQYSQPRYKYYERTYLYDIILWLHAFVTKQYSWFWHKCLNWYHFYLYIEAM